MKRIGLGCALSLLLIGSACVRSGLRFDPVTNDPVTFDAAHPPRTLAMQIPSGDASMNALLYEPQGPGPHPAALLLHGYPGYEGYLDLAQAMRRAGWHVLFLHYRGSWGSEGLFTFTHVLEDVSNAIDTLRAPDFAQSHRIDPSRIALVGHSMGGFAALLTAAEHDAVDCVVSISAANLGGMAQAVRDDPEQAAAFAALWDGRSAPIRSQSGAEQARELGARESAARFDTHAKAPDLARKKLLLIAGGRDTDAPAKAHHDPMVAALEAAGATSLETAFFENADHSFSGQRIALARKITGWLNGPCRSGD